MQSLGLEVEERGAATQTVLGLILLAFLVATWVALDLLARRDQDSLQAADLDRWKRTNGQVDYGHGFDSFEERLLSEEIPTADLSQGGVYFIGASNAKVSVMFWALPPEIRRYVRVFGLSAATHTQQFQFLRYATEHEHLLDAGEKNLVVFLLFYGNANDIRHTACANLLPTLLERDGLYSYRYEQDIEPLWTHEFERRFQVERARTGRYVERQFWRGLGMPERAPSQALGQLPGRHDAGKCQKFWSERMGPNWQSEMIEQMQQLSLAIDYLRSRHARVAAVMSPLGSWHRALPYPDAFKAGVDRICSRRAIPVTDLSGLLVDDEFADSAHATYLGQQKLHAALMRIALPHLASMGLR